MCCCTFIPFSMPYNVLQGSNRSMFTATFTSIFFGKLLTIAFSLMSSKLGRLDIP